MVSSSLVVFAILCCSLPFLVLSARFHFGATNGDLVSTTCNRTLYPELCVSSLRSEPRSATSDLRGLAQIALNLTWERGVETLSYVGELKIQLAGNDSNKYVSSCLNDCWEEYSDAVERLESSVGALSGEDYGSVNAWVTAAMSDSETCEEGFKEDPNNAGADDNYYWSPLTERNQDFSNMCSNFLAITNLLL